MMEDIKDFFLAVGLIILIFIGMVAILTIPINLVSKQSCKSSYSQYNPQYGLWSGCRIQYNGKLTPVEMIKNINLQ